MTTESTAHIDPQGPIAETILLPGDPLRARFIADTYLDDAVCFNTVRNMLGFTGTYRGREVSVMGTGMGVPSIGIYSWELINVFGVRNLVRVGTCGTARPEVDLYDIVIAQGASTDSNYLHQFGLPGTFAALSSYRLLEKAKRAADERGQKVHVGNVLSSDVFYSADATAMDRWTRMGVLAVEMESVALFANAVAAGVDALSIFTVSDHIARGEKTTPQERQTAFTAMIDIALDIF